MSAMAPVSQAVSGLVGGVGDAALKIREAITGIDPAKQAEVTELLANLESQSQKAQTDLDAAQAASPNFLIAGARPAVMWVCVLAFALNYLIEPLVTWVLRIAGSQLVLPQLDLATMMPILLGTLGLGAYRTIEKVQGVQDKH